MRQQIIVSGLGGQGTLTVTRLLAEAAAAAGLDFITSETHGMAQRGGSVISMVKVGPFRGPLITAGQADVGLFLSARNLPVHRHFVREEGLLFVNSPDGGNGERVDASGLAAGLGAPVIANLVLVGFASGRGGLFCGPDAMERTIRDVIPERHLELNLRAFHAGLSASGASHGRV